MICTICGLLWAALVADWTWRHMPQQAEYQRMVQSTAVDQMRETVRYCEEILSREQSLLKKGASSEGQIDAARFILAKYRYDLALQESNEEKQHEQNRLILEICEREMKRWQQLADQGHASDLEMYDAQFQLAWARLRIARQQQNRQDFLEQLQTIVRLSKKALSVIEQLRARTITTQQLHRAENGLLCAQYLLSKELNTPDKFSEELRRHVELFEKEWKQLMDLKRINAATFIDLYVARYYLLNAKLFLASLDNSNDRVVEQLRALIELHKETLLQVRGMNNAERERRIKYLLLGELSMYRWQLETLRPGTPLNDSIVTPKNR